MLMCNNMEWTSADVLLARTSADRMFVLLSFLAALGESQHRHARLELQHDLSQQLQVAADATECRPFTLGVAHCRRHSWDSRHWRFHANTGRCLARAVLHPLHGWPCRCHWRVGRVDAYNVYHAASAGWPQLRCAGAVGCGSRIPGRSTQCRQCHRRTVLSAVR